MIIFRSITHLLLSYLMIIPILNLANYNKFQVMLLVIGLTIGSVFPDSDIRYSPMGKLFPLWIFLEAKAFRECDPKYKTKYHRTYTHSLAFIVVILFGSAIILTLSYYYLHLAYALLITYILEGFILGNIFHIFQDSFTKSRVMLLYPFSRRSFGLRLIRVGSQAEQGIDLLAAALLLFIYKG